MKRNSLRLRLLTVAIASIVVTIGVAGASMVALFERQVLRYVEQNLNLHWTELATAFRLDDAGEPELAERLTDPRYRQPYGGAYWQVSENGRSVLRSRSLWDSELPTGVPRQAAGSDAAFEADGPDGSELYVVQRDVTLDSQGRNRIFSLSVALDHKLVRELRQAFGWDVALVLAPIAAILVLFAWLQLWLGLRPLRSVGQDLNAVQTGRMHRMTSQFPDEVSPLVASINGLLDRQEQLVRKARDRAGALAHGLKTPLTILGGEVRRMVQNGQSETAERLQEQLAAIRLLVDREVARARTSGASVGCGVYSGVDETVARLLRLMQHMPRGDELVWHTDIPADLAVEMDPHDLGEVMGNLIDNARKWARNTVTIRAERLGERTRITVEDDGPGFSGRNTALRPERGIPGRFDADSTGLGLGIVDDILAEYATTATIEGEGRCIVTFDVPSSHSGPIPGESPAAPETFLTSTAEMPRGATPPQHVAGYMQRRSR